MINAPLEVPPPSEGGLLSTVEDLAKWDAALYTEQLLKKSSLEQMWTPAKLNNGEKGINNILNENYGFGWFVGEMKGHKNVWHGGVHSGFTSAINRFIDDKLTVIVLVNKGDDDDFLAITAPRPWDIAKGVASFYFVR